jgi:cell wall-associated NlpC family hydrolase
VTKLSADHVSHLCLFTTAASLLTDKGYSTITDHCPVCEHRPMSQDLCKPNKALRNTAKAYLKTAEKKLADERAKANAVNAPAPSGVAPAPTPALDTTTPAPVDLQVEENTSTGQVGLPEAVQLEDSTSSPTQHLLADELQPSIEVSPILHFQMNFD